MFYTKKSATFVLLLLSLLFNCCFCGLEIFKFTSQPVSKPVNPGGSVTLSCVATGRTGIKYSWYKLATDFSTPPSESTDLISGATGTQYTVQAADVDEKDDRSLFQCKATAGDDIILSNVATVKYILADDIEYDSTGKTYIDVPIRTPDEEDDYGVFLYRLQCNTNELYFNKFITNGEPYDVQWFKTGESGRVEDKHNNMWTYYNNLASNLKVNVVDGFEPDLSTVGQYDLVIFNVQRTDAGTYSCKAVSRANKKEVLLGSTVLTVPEENNDYPFKPLNMVAGYMVLAVDDTGKVKSTPNDGDKVLLMCGAPCRTSSGSYDPQYQWKDSSGTVIASTREYIVTVSSTGTVTYTCEILNSQCNTDVSSKTVTFNAGAAELNPMLNFTFSKSPPDYMWYDRSDNTKSHTPFEIGCQGSISSGNVNFFNVVYKMPTPLTGASATEMYNFGSSFTSDKSGVYQCGMYNNPDKMLWHEKTTNVVIAAPPTAAIGPTIISAKHDATATFTCTVGGYPVKSVKISGPNSLDLDCISSQSSGDVTCSSTDAKKYVVKMQNFELSDAGNYICTVKTEWYKSRSSSAIVKSAQDEVTLSLESTTKLTASSNPANKGSSVTLTCVVKGSPEPSKPELSKTVSSSTTNIDMTCNGTTIKTCKKEFSSAVYTDSGDYTCIGENLIDSVQKSSSDTLTFFIVGDADASLVQNPAGTELDKDSSVAFTCKIEGNPRPTKLTFKKGSTSLKSYDANTGSSDSDIVTATYDISYTHTISHLALDNTGEYTCEGENDNSGTKTDTAPSLTLTVVSDVVVKITASSTTPSVGTAFTITCTATGGRKPHSVELKQGDTLISGTGFSCSDVGDYSVKCTYQHTAGYTSGGTYSCIGKNRVASNAERVDTKTLDVAVSKEVAVSLTPSSDTEIEVTYGSAYTITCNVEGGDKPHKVTLNIPDSSTDLTWQRDSSWSTLTCNGEFQLVCKYTIANLAYSHEGQYTCTGYNKLPGENSDRTDDASVSLVVIKDVEVKLTDSINTNANEVYFGNLFTVACVADGGRIPFYLELSHTPTTSSRNQLVLYDSSSSTTPVTVTVDQGANTLTYVHSVTSSRYDNSGTYTCSSKNKAAVNVEANDEKDVEILVVKDVEIDPIADIEADFGSSFTISFTLNGGRSPHSVTLDSPGSSRLFNWQTGGSECTGTNTLNCSYTIGGSDVNFEADGTFTVTSRNRAKSNVEKSATKKFQVTVFKDVAASISPSSDISITYHEDKTITCKVEGGLPPHQVDLFLGNQGTKTWKKDGSETSLTCTGTHTLTCEHTFTPEYNSDGDYKCKGYNEVRTVQKEIESPVVRLTTVRPTTVTILKNTMSVLTHGTITVDCIIVGKPLVDESAVTWTHEKHSDLDLSQFVNTVKETDQYYTLTSTLNIKNPPASYSGIFKCNVQDELQQLSESIQVSINNKEFLDPPKVTHTGGKSIKAGFEISVSCRVEGFPRPSATLTYQNMVDGAFIQIVSLTAEPESITSTVFVYKLTSSCDYSRYRFICNTQTDKITEEKVLFVSSSIDGPIVTGCESSSAEHLGIWIGLGVAALLFVIMIVAGIYILRSRRKHNEAIGENVTYVNTAVSKPTDVETYTELKYDEIILQEVTSGKVYNDVVLPAKPAVDDTPYDYARNEDVVRNKVREDPTYHNHELKDH